MVEIYSGTPTSLIFGQDTDMNVLKDCNTIAHELVPIVTMSSNGTMHQHQYLQTLPEMLDNIPDMQQHYGEQNESMMLPQLDMLHQQQMQSLPSPPTTMPPPPPSQMNIQNILTGVYTLQEEPEDVEENTTM